VLGRIIRQPKNAVPSESPGEEKAARGKHRRIQTSARVRPNPPKKFKYVQQGKPCCDRLY
jgi:hypothetical protein